LILLFLLFRAAFSVAARLSASQINAVLVPLNSLHSDNCGKTYKVAGFNQKNP